ncbi:TRAP transporter small permease [Brevibacillus massiliensis]|uniref:TRAP transporter small permease n=1 Tax=Brevibacillus massiliensis TaxID=1118054 RepID=UPI0002F148C1|nr:TRAP transporter small permease [Brevibacillus massiliensis]
MKTQNPFLNLLDRIVQNLTIILFSSMTIIVFSQVFARFVLNQSIDWAEEYARYAMIWIAFLGAAMGVKRGEHTRIDFFINLLKPNIKKWMEVFNCLLCIVFLGFLTYYAIDFFPRAMIMKSTALEIPMGAIQLILPISGVIMILYYLAEIYSMIRKSPENVEKEGEIAC